MSPTRLKVKQAPLGPCVSIPSGQVPVEPEGTKKNNNKNPRARHLLKKFGLTTEQYDALLLKQQGCCAICGRHSSSFKVRLAVDHDHHSKLVRGLLCNYCNRRVVGRHRKENGASLLKAAYEYLIAEYPGWVVPPKIKKKRKKRRRK